MLQLGTTAPVWKDKFLRWENDSVGEGRRGKEWDPRSRLRPRYTTYVDGESRWTMLKARDRNS